MQVLIEATEDQKNELTNSKRPKADAECHFVSDIRSLQSYDSFDAFFFLKEKAAATDFSGRINKPVILNSVVDTLEQLNAPSNFSRMNAWPGFLTRPVYEVATNEKVAVARIFDTLGWKVVFVKDEPGFVAARVLAMIINEAYFALGDNITSREEMDIAMKLGTNYPIGPFEWANNIGLEKVYELLKKLSKSDQRYAPAPLLEQELGRTAETKFL